MNTLAVKIAHSLRLSAQEFAAGDQVAPVAVLWADPDRLWESVVPELQASIPELLVLGAYATEKRTGPAIWLRCVEARVLDPSLAATPIFYLPGVARDQIRAAETCPAHLAPLVELQYRGTMWLQPNRKEWTPHAFLVAKQGGLDLDVAKDRATLDALTGALSALLSEPLSHLRGKRLDSEFFNGLLAPDSTGSLLRWMNDPDTYEKRRSDGEWKAFREQCNAEFHFDPKTDGALVAARLLAKKAGAWSGVWRRFCEAPANHANVVHWLKRAAPKNVEMFDTSEVWPDLNETEEKKLKDGLEALVNCPEDQAIKGIVELEKQHATRRRYPWQKLGLSPLATALEPLAQLAELCRSAPGAPTPEAFAILYATEGWRVDAAALETLAACGAPEQHGAVLSVVRAIYLPWLEKTARHLQKLIHENGQSVSRRLKAVMPEPGRVVIFADGLRMDVAKLLATAIREAGMRVDEDWDWSGVPAVTATAKPAASPIADALQGSDDGADFAARLTSGGQLLTQDRFVRILKDRQWQVLDATETGDPAGWAWTEAGTLDKRGHNDGWKLARSVKTEIAELASRIGALKDAGWSEIVIVTDHGWLLMPNGLPKVELKSFLTESKWGRCATLKAGAQADAMTFKWFWNPAVLIASPPGVGCFKASMEYAHGGISLQELVTPVLRLTTGKKSGTSARISEAKWTGAKCRITVEGDFAGVCVDLRTAISDPATSLLADKQARELTADGKVTVFLEDDGDIGKKAELVLINATGQVIGSLATTLGG